MREYLDRWKEMEGEGRKRKREIGGESIAKRKKRKKNAREIE